MAPAAPRHPMLRPGLCVARRDERTLQVGLERGRSALLPDSAEMRAALAALAAALVPDPAGDLTTDAARAALATLQERDLVVERTELTSALRGESDPVRRSAVSAAFAQHGAATVERLRDRAGGSVSLRVLGVDALVTTWTDSIQSLLDAAGVGTVTVEGDPAADVTVVLSAGEPDRDRFDEAMATGAPHLVVTVVEGAARVGPFVLPGHTACLRCVDAHLDERDERRGVVLGQVTRPERSLVALPVPSDPALTTMALAWAARDVVSFLDGDRPATWSTTVDLDAALDVVATPWLRHPHCGCCWGDLRDAL